MINTIKDSTPAQQLLAEIYTDRAELRKKIGDAIREFEKKYDNQMLVNQILLESERLMNGQRVLIIQIKIDLDGN